MWKVCISNFRIKTTTTKTCFSALCIYIFIQATLTSEQEKYSLDFDSGHDIRFIRWSPTLGLRAEQGACLGFSLSLPLPLSPACALSKKK